MIMVLVGAGLQGKITRVEMVGLHITLASCSVGSEGYSGDGVVS